MMPVGSRPPAEYMSPLARTKAGWVVPSSRAPPHPVIWKNAREMLAIRTRGKDASTWEPAFAADAGPRYVQFHAVRPDPLNRIPIDEAISPAFPLISTS